VCQMAEDVKKAVQYELEQGYTWGGVLFDKGELQKYTKDWPVTIDMCPGNVKRDGLT